MSTRQFPKHTVSATQPMGGQAGDEWFNPTTNQLYKMLVGNGNSPQWQELAQPSLIASSPTTWTRPQTFNNSVAINGSLNLIGNVSQTGNIVMTNTVQVVSPIYGTSVSDYLRSYNWDGNHPNTNVMTIPFTVISGQNRCLVITISMNDAGPTITAPTWTVSGIIQTFTLLGYANSQKSSIWHLVAPTVGAGNVVINISQGSYWEAGVSSFTGVNQSSPMDKFVAIDGTISSNGGITSNNYSGVDGELLISNLSYYSQSGTVTAGSSNQTMLWQNSADGGHRGVSFFQPSALSVTVLHTFGLMTQSQTYVLIMGSLKSVSVASSTISSSNAQLNLSLGASSYWSLTTGLQSLNISNLMMFNSLNNRIGIFQETPNSTLHVSGSFSVAILSITGSTTLNETHNVVLCGGTSSYQVTLPTAVGIAGRIYQIKKTSTSAYTLTIGTTSSQTIDGSTSLGFATQYNNFVVISDGANWSLL